MMKHLIVSAIFLLSTSHFVASAQSEAKPEAGAKQDAKDAGSDAKKAAKDTGNAAKKTGSAVKKETKKGVHAASEKVGEGADKVKDKTK